MYGSEGRMERQRSILTRLKAHIGVDSRSKLIHSVVASAANVHDSQALPYLLHGKERRVWGDSAYRGQREVIRKAARHARDFTQEKATSNHPLSDQQRSRNRTKSKVRAKVKYCFLIIKRNFGFNKVHYRGFAKNLHRLQVTCALTKLFSARNYLMRVTA